MLSIIIPCYREEKFIAPCLDSIINQDVPKDELEVIIVDGMSQDKTREIIKRYQEKYSYIKLLDNPRRITPCAMNIGIRASSGEYVLILGSHSELGQSYLKKCIEYFNIYQVDNLGGANKIIAADDSLEAKAIALAGMHYFGVGNAHYRIGTDSVIDSDPSFGCYRREVFARIGYIDENLVRNQDIEFNSRLRMSGGRIMLVPDICVYYHARANYKELFKQLFSNGYWAIFNLKFRKTTFFPRHLIPIFFVLGLLVALVSGAIYPQMHSLLLFIIGVYLLLNFIVSAIIAIKTQVRYFPYLVLSFITLHFAFGLGAVCSVWMLFWGLVLQRITNSKDKTGQGNA